jgi:hypothetical protein
MLIGTAGHVDHGKTTPVKALTGMDADRLPEARARHHPPPRLGQDAEARSAYWLFSKSGRYSP